MHLPIKYHTNFNNIAEIVLRIDYKSEYPRKLVKIISLLVRSVISKGNLGTDCRSDYLKSLVKTVSSLVKSITSKSISSLFLPLDVK